MSKQTSIDWFNEQIINKQNGNGDSRSWDELLQHAQQMHNEEIESAFDNGYYRETIGYNAAKRYYTQTYGGNNEPCEHGNK